MKDAATALKDGLEKRTVQSSTSIPSNFTCEVTKPRNRVLDLLGLSGEHEGKLLAFCIPEFWPENWRRLINHRPICADHLSRDRSKPLSASHQDHNWRPGLATLRDRGVDRHARTGFRLIPEVIALNGFKERGMSAADQFAGARQYLARVIAWPDESDAPVYVNIHWTFKGAGYERAAWSGRAVRSIQEAVSEIGFALTRPDTRDVYVCMSTQRQAEEATSQKGRKYYKPIRLQTNAVALKSFSPRSRR
jgi:hypothetical protein